MKIKKGWIVACVYIIGMFFSYSVSRNFMEKFNKERNIIPTYSVGDRVFCMGMSIFSWGNVFCVEVLNLLNSPSLKLPANW